MILQIAIAVKSKIGLVFSGVEGSLNCGGSFLGRCGAVPEESRGICGRAGSRKGFPERGQRSVGLSQEYVLTAGGRKRRAQFGACRRTNQRHGAREHPNAGDHRHGGEAAGHPVRHQEWKETPRPVRRMPARQSARWRPRAPKRRRSAAWRGGCGPSGSAPGDGVAGHDSYHDGDGVDEREASR